MRDVKAWNHAKKSSAVLKSRTIALTSLVFAALLAEVACSSTSSSSFVPQSNSLLTQPTTVPIALQQGAFRIDIKVGGGARRRVVFDTGSTGLHFLSLDVGKNVRVTKKRFTPYSYESGTTYKGYIAYADIDLGNGTVIKNARFAYVTYVGCIRQIPNCPGASGIKGAQASGAYGVMGVRLDDGQQVPSPLDYLAPPLNTGFVVTRNALYLGLPQDLRRTFHTVHLIKEPYQNADGVQAWSTVVNVRWHVDGKLLTGQPIGTDFDSGNTTVRIHGRKTIVPPDEVNQSGNLVRGLNVEASIPRVFHYSFASGRIAGTNLVQVLVPATPFVNAGVDGFKQLDIMFDPVNGLMGFKPAST